MLCLLLDESMQAFPSEGRRAKGVEEMIEEPEERTQTDIYNAGKGHRCIECQKTRYEKKGSFIYCPATGVIRYCMLRLSDEACEMFTPFRSGGEEPDGQSRTEWI